MPRQKDFKRLVRTRMKKTGEAYTTARARILDKKQPATKAAAPAGAKPRTTDYAKLAGMSDAAVKAKTGCTWERWVYALDRRGADKMAHREIVDIVHEKYKVDDWWAQTVTVGYERIKGLREKGQRRGGRYEASKSRTFNVSVGELFAAFADLQALRRWLPEAANVRTASKNRSARLGLQDGSIAAFWFTEKGDGKSAVSVQQAKLPDKAAAARAKQYWGTRLSALSDFLP